MLFAMTHCYPAAYQVARVLVSTPSRRARMVTTMPRVVAASGGEGIRAGACHQALVQAIVDAIMVPRLCIHIGNDAERALCIVGGSLRRSTPAV